MGIGKLFQALAVLEENTFRHFGEFLSCRLYNKHKGVIALYEQVAKFFPDLEHPALANEQLFETIYPGKEYNRQKLYDVQNYTLERLRLFIAMESLQKDPFGQELRFLEQLRNSGEYHQHEIVLKALRKKTTKSPVRDESFWLEQYRIESEAEEFFNVAVKEMSRMPDSPIESKMHALDVFYLSSRLRHYCEMINRQNIIGASYDLSGMESLLTYYWSGIEKWKSVPSIETYYQILQLLCYPEEIQHYEILKPLLRRNHEYFTREEMRSMYAFAQNYCIRRINRGETVFEAELYELFMELIETGLLYEHGKLSQWDYKNIVTLGLRLKKYESVLSFIEEYKSRLAEEVRENAHLYNLANYFFESGQYGNALRLLQKVEFSDFSYQVGARAMLLKIYFEQDDLDPLFAHFDAFRVFLQRTKGISAYNRKVYQHFVQLAKKVYQLRLELGEQVLSATDRKLVKSLRDQIETTNPLANKSWLLAQLPVA